MNYLIELLISIKGHVVVSCSGRAHTHIYYDSLKTITVLRRTDTSETTRREAQSSNATPTPRAGIFPSKEKLKQNVFFLSTRHDLLLFLLLSALHRLTEIEQKETLAE